MSRARRTPDVLESKNPHATKMTRIGSTSSRFGRAGCGTDQTKASSGESKSEKQPAADATPSSPRVVSDEPLEMDVHSDALDAPKRTDTDESFVQQSQQMSKRTYQTAKAEDKRRAALIAPKLAELALARRVAQAVEEKYGGH